MAVRVRKVLARPWVGVRVCHLLLLLSVGSVRFDRNFNTREDKSISGVKAESESFEPVKKCFFSFKDDFQSVLRSLRTLMFLNMTELKSDCACHQFARENWGCQGETIATYK